MLPIHLIGELATPISLSFRLFGANLGAFIIMELYYSLMPVWLRFGIPAVLHGYFDLFAGSLQAFIFVTLSMTFIGAKVPQQGDAAH
jgi:F-type H+-transporting ATPase subunit a